MGDMYLLLSFRAVRDYVFAEELMYLESRHPNLHVRVLVSQDPDTPWNGLRGQITRDVIAEFVPNLTRGPVMLCGPGPMKTAMRATLVGMGVPNEDVLQEEFVSRPPVESAPFDGAPGLETRRGPLAESAAQVVFTRTGRTIDITADRSLLEGAEEHGIDLPYECRSGICGQCKTHLRSGRVRMDVQDALSSRDRAAGFILACQAHALGNLEVEA